MMNGPGIGSGGMGTGRFKGRGTVDIEGFSCPFLLLDVMLQ
jgi:hypothetical protein